MAFDQEAAAVALNGLWELSEEGLPDLAPELRTAISTAMSAREKSPRHALVTQLLFKHLHPEIDIHQLDKQHGLPSARTFARKVTAPFDAAHGAPLGGAADPYVSNPLRRKRLTPDVGAESSDAASWDGLLKVLDAVEADPSVSASAVAHAVAAMKSKVFTPRSLLAAVLAASEGGHELRELVTSVAPHVLSDEVFGLDVEGSVGHGSSVEVPWIRVFDRDHSPSAQQGWYVAYLFVADRSAVYLALLQGVTEGDEIEHDAAAMRAQLSIPDGFGPTIDLKSSQPSPSSRPRLYERATAIAKAYDAATLPSDAELVKDLAALCDLLEQLYDSLEPPIGDVDAISLESVLAELESDGIEIDRPTVITALAAIRGGQHILLTGPPGTGKTSLAVALGRAAVAANAATGFTTVTATADWTATETLGGYWPTDDGSLSFQSGYVLQALEDNHWLIIDEFNRSDADKAFGPLFTVLSGQSVRLPYLEKHGDDMVPVEIVPTAPDPEGGLGARFVPESWRIIATLNTRDRDLLFTLSYALLRRFAIIDVGVPGQVEMEEILMARGSTGSGVLDASLNSLIALPHRKLGPAILLDTQALLKQQLCLAPDDAEPQGLVAAALQAFVAPQLDDLSRPQQADVVKFIRQKVLVGATESVARRALGFDSLHAASPPATHDAADYEAVELLDEA